MKLSLSGRLWETSNGYRITLAEHIRTAARLGYRGIEVRYPLLPKTEEISSVRDLLEEQRVRAVFAFCAGVPADDASREDARRVIETVRALGGTHVRVVVRSETELPAVRELAASAGPGGIRVAVHVHTDTLCDSADKSLAILRAIDHPNVCLLVDPIHLVLAGEPDLAGAIARLGSHIGLVNLQNFRRAPAETAGSLRVYGQTWVPAPPGHAQGLDFRAALAALRQAGYDGWLNVMCTTAATEDPVSVARAYVEHLQPLLSV